MGQTRPGRHDHIKTVLEPEVIDDKDLGSRQAGGVSDCICMDFEKCNLRHDSNQHVEDSKQNTSAKITNVMLNCRSDKELKSSNPGSVGRESIHHTPVNSGILPLQCNGKTHELYEGSSSSAQSTSDFVTSKSDNFTQGPSDDILLRQKKIIENVWPTTTPLARQEFPSFCDLYEEIRAKGLPNFLGAKIPVSSNLHIQKWKEYLNNYHDKEIVEFLEYGWPIGFHSEVPPESVNDNHPSAKNYNNQIKKFVAKELTHGALVGPFTKLPFQPWCRLSPLMTRAKKASFERRVIMDLSFPQGSAPNDGIDINQHFGKDISYTLPTVNDLVTKLQDYGRGAFIWKGDLARAYRQIRIDPLDTPLLGLKVDDSVYLDLCPAFGCKSSSAACQRMSNAFTYIMGKKGHFVLAYLDDFAGAHNIKSEADAAYSSFQNLAQELGLQLAEEKCVPPTTNIEWLGFNIDTTRMTVSIPKSKLEETINECDKWCNRKRANRRMIQSILGKLIHISACINQGRKFVSRIIDALRAMGERNWTNISDDFLLDIKWFRAYAQASNGIHLYQPDRREVHFECDSSKDGGGGHGAGFCYAWEYTSAHKLQFQTIHQLEAVNIVVAYRTLVSTFKTPGVHVIIFTDNSASSFAIQSGKTKDKVLASCSREMWLEAAKNDHVISIVHKPGTELLLADALSRRFTEPAKALLADEIIHRQSLSCINPVLNDYMFFTVNL